MKPVLYVLCGLQGSGKSTYAKKFKLGMYGDETIVIASSDEVRKQYPDAKNETIFQFVYQMANDALADGKSVIIDATNITIKSRRQVFANIKVDCEKICVVFCTPYEECVKRVKDRNALSKATGDHFVPLDVLERYYKSFEVPFIEEGWDYIWFSGISNIIDTRSDDEIIADLVKQADGFDQHNKHHTKNLGDHMRATGDFLARHYPKEMSVVRAGYLHDVGKLFTQTFGEDGQAHYYSHANVGAYEILSRVFMPIDWLDVVFYVNYHMHLYNIQSDKAEKKWERIFGGEKWQMLKMLHEADMTSHTKGETKC